MGMELMYGIPFLASRLGIEKMFYSSNLGSSITPIIGARGNVCKNGSFIFKRANNETIRI
jgi:hypothetical protein